MLRRMPSLDAVRASEAVVRHPSFGHAANQPGGTQGVIGGQVEASEERSPRIDLKMVEDGPGWLGAAGLGDLDHEAQPAFPGGSFFVAHWLNFDPPSAHSFANRAKFAEGKIYRNCFACVVDGP